MTLEVTNDLSIFFSHFFLLIDCERHVNGVKHKSKATSVSGATKITDMFKPATDNSTIRAEALFCSFLTEHNVPIALADHSTHLFKKMFPDSKIAKNYACGRTKATNIIKTMAKDDDNSITQNMLEGPFSIATDGSNDCDDVKLYPIVVRYFDKSVGRVLCVLLKLCESRESTGVAIFYLINGEFNDRKIKWSNCLSFAADNAAVMQGLHKGMASYILKEQPSVYMLKCACHLMHLTAEKAAKELSVNIEDMLISIFYYLDKSSKRKGLLKDLQRLCNTETRKILKCVSTRWLSLNECNNRLWSNGSH